MKKFLISALSIVAATCAAVGFAACSGDVKNNLLNVTLPDYEYTFNPEFEDDYATDMKIDGVLDEEKWKNQQWLTHVERGVLVKYTTILDEYGVYLAGVAYDPDITYYGRFDMYDNSGFSIYMTREENDRKHNTDVLRMELDAYDRRSYYQSRFAGQAKVDGVIDSGETKSMTMEMFVSWKNLSVDTTDGIPQRVKIEPIYRKVVKNDEKSRSHYNIYPTFTEPAFISLYPYFGATGYLSADIEGSPLGSAKNGLAATSGWDLSEIQNGKVKSTRGDSQALFFRQVASDNFVAKATVKPIGSISNGSPKFGLIASQSFDNFRAIYVDSNGFTAKKNLTVSTMTYYPGRRFQETAGVYRNLSYTGFGSGGTAELEYVKCGTLLLFFVNGELVHSESQSWYDGVYAPGLYTLGCEAEFTNFEAVELSTQEMESYLDAKGVSRIEIQSSRGGSVSSNKYAVKAGESFDIAVAPSLGYVLNSLKINGEEKFDDFCAKVKDGKYTCQTSNVAGEQIVLAEFVRLDASATNRNQPIWGKLVSSQNQKVGVGNATITVQSSYPFLYYSDSAGTSGDYYFDYFPVKGTKIATVGGQEIIADGKYTVTFTSGVYRPLVKEYVITSEGVEREENLIMTNRVLGGNVSTSAALYESNNTGWDLTEESNGIVVAGKGSGNKVLYFSGVSSKQAVLDFTATDDTPMELGYDLEPGMGFVIANENITLGVILVGGNIRVLPSLDWNQSSLYSSNGVFHTSLKENKGKFYKVKVVHDGDLLAILVANEGSDDYKLVYAERMAELNAVSAYGLVSTSAGTPNVIFKDYSLTPTKAACNAVADEFLRFQLSIKKPDIGTLSVVDKDTGDQVQNGDKLIAGGLLDVVAVAPDGYFVYALNYNGKNVRLNYNLNASTATCQLTFKNGGEISVTFLPMEEKGKAIDFVMTPRMNDDGNGVVSYQEMNVNLVQYSTDPAYSAPGAKAIEQFVTVVFTPTVSDFTEFAYIDFTMYEENSKTRIVPAIVDGDGGFYTLGGADKATLTGVRTDLLGGKTTFTADHWQGVLIGGNSLATYRFACGENNMARYDTLGITGHNGVLNLNDVKNISVGIYAYIDKGHNYTLSFGEIYGVKADGTKVKLFDPLQANVLENGTENNTDVAGDVQIYWFELNNENKNICYQRLTKQTSRKITVPSADGLWEIYDNNKGYQFVWQTASNTKSDEKYLNLAFYDALTFTLDTTQMSAGVKLSSEIAMFTGTDVDKMDCRPYYAYAISEDGSVQKLGNGSGICYLPAGFKGTIVVLLKDFTKNRKLTDVENVYNYFNIITDVKGMGGEKFKISDLKIVSNGEQLVKQAMENQAK
ncbi:MAG: hypothetical protein IIX01_04835 [Clostridia bacterium]|nr:hypothetical protein [Clostridia bacterium]